VYHLYPEEVIIHIPPHTEEDIKEVYALFGLAYYNSELLHRALCFAYMLSTLPPREAATKPRVEEIMKKAFSLTFGAVLKEVENMFDASLKDRLESALESRNFLAHHFWFDRCHLMHSESGLSQMQTELRQMASLFGELDGRVSALITPKFSAIGVTDEMLEVEVTRILRGEPPDPFPTQRAPHKHENIVKAWDVPVDDGETLVLQSADGALWQLCDAGLGWSIYQKPESTWRESELINPHLPATVMSRPPCHEPWNYEFVLQHKRVLRIRKSPKEAKYRLTLGKAKSDSR
jgi:hypothetical protein